jgi:hypothetical protein
MLEKRTIHLFLVPLVLVALLAMATAGSIWHHHANSTETNCPICHLNHQPFEQPLADNSTTVLAPLGPQAEPQEPAFAPAPVFRRIAARAPPAA